MVRNSSLSTLSSTLELPVHKPWIWIYSPAVKLGSMASLIGSIMIYHLSAHGLLEPTWDPAGFVQMTRFVLQGFVSGVCVDYQKLCQDLHQYQGRVAGRHCTSLLWAIKLPPRRGQAHTGTALCQERKASQAEQAELSWHVVSVRCTVSRCCPYWLYREAVGVFGTCSN